jgi:hypothetical protein
MLSRIEFANNASTRIAKDLQIGDKTITVASGETAYFPELSHGDSYFLLTLVDESGNFEIVKCTAKSDTTFTVERAQEGTTAKFFKQGTIVENRLTAGSITQLFQQVTATEQEHGILKIASSDEIRNGITTSGTAPAACTPETLKPVLDEQACITGAVVAFSGSFDGVYPIPRGKTTKDTRWRLCNGDEGTPDLRNRFIMGCNSTSDIGQSGGSNTMTGTTGPCTLTVAQMPRHNHTYIRYASLGGEGQSWNQWYNTTTSNTGDTGSSQSHTHPLSASSDNRPAYYTLAYIMKIR